MVTLGVYQGEHRVVPQKSRPPTTVAEDGQLLSACTLNKRSAPNDRLPAETPGYVLTLFNSAKSRLPEMAPEKRF